MGSPSRDDVFPVLDTGQLRRIEGTHRGFLYQHVYGAACLLLAGRASVSYVAIERDEDIELRLPATHVYVQVKTRLSSLQWNDIEGAVETFNKQVSQAHMDARRPLGAELWIVSNVAPSPSLQERLGGGSWPTNVRLLWPGCKHEIPSYLPPAWPTIAAGIAWCSDIARSLPFAGLLPETLVWKLAATVQLAATGGPAYPDHHIRTDDLPQLFELIATQLQRFPQAPSLYRQLEDEPELISSERLRIIIGVSGAGKTSWATESARHAETPVAYFDVAQLPAEAVPPGIARDLASAFLADADAARSVFAPGLAGLDSLRLLDRVLNQYGRNVTVVVDNAHSIDASIYRQMVDATTRIHWVLLAQPRPELDELAEALGAPVVQLKPWTQDSVVAEFAAQGCPVTAHTAERLRRLTGSLPLFTRQAAGLTARNYGGNAMQLCQDLENLTHTVRTAQEAILEKASAMLDEATRRVGAVLSLSEVPLTACESLDLATKTLSINREEAASSIRMLRQAGVVGTDTIGVSVHDIFRLVFGGSVLSKDCALATSARLALKDVVRASLAASWDFRRFGFLLRLLVATGDEATVVDISTSMEERLLEYGMVPEVRAVLEGVAKSSTKSGESRFWAKDTLVYWSVQQGDDCDFAEQVRELAELNAALPPDKKRLASLLIKQMLLAGRRGDVSAAKEHCARAEAECHDDSELLRILKYDLALALFKAKSFAEASEITGPLINEYYDLLGLKPEDVLFANPPEIAARLSDAPERQDALKQLADTLELHASALGKQGRPSGLARIHAFKFFSMVSAFTSAVRVGQDVADDLLKCGDPVGALKILDEHLLPLINHTRLLEYLVQVRAQRAVMLAYVGRYDDARKEMNCLGQFVASDAERMAELRRQQELVEDIASGRIRLQRTVAIEPLLSAEDFLNVGAAGRRKAGRNEPCPCGSGRKYKKCHGR